jgi:hypothetical protein
MLRQWHGSNVPNSDSMKEDDVVSPGPQPESPYNLAHEENILNRAFSIGRAFVHQRLFVDLVANGESRFEECL